MKKITAFVLAMICAFTVMPFTAFADSGLEMERAAEILDPEAPNYEDYVLEKKEALLEELTYQAYYVDKYMAIPNLRNLLDEPVKRYVRGYQGYADYYDAPDGKVLGNFLNSTTAVVYARRGDWSFVKISDGTLGWVKTNDIMATAPFYRYSGYWYIVY